MLDSASEVGLAQPMGLAIAFEEPDPQLPPEMVVEAIRAHFRHELERARARLSTHWQRTRYLMGVGLSVLVAFLALAEVVTLKLPEGPARQILREGLVITGWVAIWRPLEALLYDWWPLVRERKKIIAVLKGSIEVRG